MLERHKAGHGHGCWGVEGIKVFWFFSSEKNILLKKEGRAVDRIALGRCGSVMARPASSTHAKNPSPTKWETEGC
jgi:hypothetical protein